MSRCRFVSVLALTGVALGAVGCGESIGDSAGTGGTGSTGSGGTTAGGASTSGEDGASPWAGMKYFLSLNGKWTAPRGIGRDIDYFVPSFILAVSGETAADLSMTMAPAAPDATPANAVQDPCGSTEKVAFSGSSYPKVAIHPASMRVHIENAPAGEEPVQAIGSVYGFTMTDVLPETSSTTSAGNVTATLDVRELYKLFTQLGPTVSPDGVCEAFKDQFTPVGCESDPTCWVACGPCPNDDEPYCLTVEAEDVGAVEAPHLDIVEVSEASRPVTCADP